MRVTIVDSRADLLPNLFGFLEVKILNKKVKSIIDGREMERTITLLEYDEKEFKSIKIGNEEFVHTIPITEDSTIRFDRDLFFLETGAHTILIYV